MSLFQELKRRNVFRVGIAYVLLGWAVLQAADFLLDLAGAPDWVIRSLAVIGLVGLPFALFFAWAFEMTPEGLKREEDVDRSQAIPPKPSKTLNGVIISLLLLVILLMVMQRAFFDGGPATRETPATVAASPASVVPQVQDNQNSVAVLPFVNMSSDPENEYFSEGVSEEILNVLAGVPELKVTARTSSFSYKGSEATIAEIAAELGVRHVLEGSVRKDGDRVRVTAQLIEAGKDFHLWSETYDRKLDDIFAIQDEIAQAIATALKVHLLPAAEQPNYTGTTNLDAYELFLQGVNQWHLRSGESLEQALALFQQAVELDTKFARAYAYLALTWGVLPDYSDRPLAVAQQATRENAEIALALDPDSVEAATALIQPLLADTPATLQSLVEQGRELIAGNPGFATTHQWHGTNLLNAGFVEEARNSYRMALDLDPLSRIIQQNLATLLLSQGQFEVAERLLDNLESLAPEYWDGAHTQFLLYLLSGNRQRAEAAGNRLAQILGRNRNTVALYLELFFEPDREAAAAAEILAFPRHSWWDPDSPALIDSYALPLVLAKAGFAEMALAVLRETLERDTDSDYYPVALVRTSPIIADFNCRPEVQEFFAASNLPPLPFPPDC